MRAALVIALALMYQAPITGDYLMNDEVANIGGGENPLHMARWSFLSMGRGVGGAVHALEYNLVGFSPRRVKCVRFLVLVLLAGFAVRLFGLLARHGHSPGWALGTALFLCAQRPFQGLMGYSLGLFPMAVPAFLFSLLAFHLHFFVFEGRRRWLTLLLLLLALQSAQVYACVALIPVVQLALREWSRWRARIWSFLALAAVSLVIAGVQLALSAAWLHRHSDVAYPLVENALGQTPLSVLLAALNPASYWGAFELWSYPFPFNRTPIDPELRRWAAWLLGAAWLALVAACMRREDRPSAPAGFSRRCGWSPMRRGGCPSIAATYPPCWWAW